LPYPGATAQPIFSTIYRKASDCARAQAGEVMQIGKVTANAFIEPQYPAYKYDEQVPHWQIFAGLNFQF
jgi:hypothetical protein